MAQRMRRNPQEHEHRFMLSRRLLIKMLISCIIVTMLPLLLCNLQYHDQLLKARKEGEESVTRHLNQSRTRYDEAIRELDKAMIAILGDSELRTISNAENPFQDTRNLYRFIRAQQRIAQIAHYYDVLDNLILLNTRSGFAIASNATYLKMDLLAPAMEKRYSGFIWPQELIEELSEEKHLRQQWIYPSHRENNEAIAVHISPLKINQGSHLILSVLNYAKVLERMQVYDEIDIVIYNHAGQRLSGAPAYDITDEQLLKVQDSSVIFGTDGQKYLVMSAASEATAHQLYAVAPYARIESGLISLQIVNRVYFGIVILCTLILCALVTWINMKPLDAMLRFLFGHDGINVSRTLNWKMIEARIHEIFRKNDELADSLQMQRESLLNHLTYELACNSSGSSERILKRMERLNISIEGDYSLLVLELPRTESDMDFAAMSLLIHKCIRYRFPGVIALQNVTTRKYLVLIKDVSWEELEQGWALFTGDIQTALQATPRGCGCQMGSLREIDQLYWDAAMTLEVHTDEFGGLLTLLEEHDGTLSLQYPQRLEQDIVTALISGNPELLEEALNNLYDLNNEDHMMSVVSARLLWELVSATVAVTLTRMKNVPEMLQLKTILSLRQATESENRYDFSHKILSSLDSIFILTRKESSPRLHRSELGRRIVDYIQLHLSEPDLCLQMVADHFNLSSAYISSLVKDETGQSFSIYCERLRIANACEMLREGKQIQSVAEAVGYSSAHTFRRVFKKVVGILPSQYSGQ